MPLEIKILPFLSIKGNVTLHPTHGIMTSIEFEQLIEIYCKSKSFGVTIKIGQIEWILRAIAHFVVFASSDRQAFV